MKYRIVKKTLRNGSFEYWVQKKFLFFWINVDEMISFGYYKNIYFTRLCDAEEYVKSLYQRDNSTYNSKVIKKEIVK